MVSDDCATLMRRERSVMQLADGIYHLQLRIEALSTGDGMAADFLSIRATKHLTDEKNAAILLWSEASTQVAENIPLVRSRNTCKSFGSGGIAALPRSRRKNKHAVL